MKRRSPGIATIDATIVRAPLVAVAMTLGAQLILVSAGDASESPKSDKSRYTLFNPTPREVMREMNTDRPDKTESPYTVDAGHFQIEADILNYTYDRYNPAQADARVETVSITPMNLKLGLCDNVDLQLVLETYTSVRTRDVSSGSVRKNRGFGDVLVRTKWNA